MVVAVYVLPAAKLYPLDWGWLVSVVFHYVEALSLLSGIVLTALFGPRVGYKRRDALRLLFPPEGIRVAWRIGTRLGELPNRDWPAGTGEIPAQGPRSAQIAVAVNSYRLWRDRRARQAGGFSPARPRPRRPGRGQRAVVTRAFRMVVRAARQYGPNAGQTLDLRQDYAVALHRCGEYEEAEAELAAVIAQRELTTGAADYGLLHAKGWHARVLSDLGRFEEAEQEWRELSQERERLFGASHPDTVDARANHAATQAMLDQARKQKPSRAWRVR